MEIAFQTYAIIMDGHIPGVTISRRSTACAVFLYYYLLSRLLFIDEVFVLWFVGHMGVIIWKIWGLT